MTNPDKYFIVAPDLDVYDAVIRSRQLDPGRCFFCVTRAEAERDVEINGRQGIVAAIVEPVPPQLKGVAS